MSNLSPCVSWVLEPKEPDFFFKQLNNVVHLFDKQYSSVTAALPVGDTSKFNIEYLFRKQALDVNEDLPSGETGVIEFGAYSVALVTGNGAQEINPFTGRGGGDLYDHNGYVPMLFFAALASVLRSTESGATDLVFCDELGNVVELHTWQLLEKQLRRLSLDVNQARRDNEQGDFIFSFDNYLKQIKAIPCSYF